MISINVSKMNTLKVTEEEMRSRLGIGKVGFLGQVDILLKFREQSWKIGMS